MTVYSIDKALKIIHHSRDFGLFETIFRNWRVTFL